MAKNAFAKKLRLKPGQQIAIVDAPEGYLEEPGPLPEGVEMAAELTGQFD